MTTKFNHTEEYASYTNKLPAHLQSFIQTLQFYAECDLSIYYNELQGTAYRLDKSDNTLYKQVFNFNDSGQTTGFKWSILN